MQSIKINGVLDGLTATTASGWVNVIGDTDKTDSKPFITISVGDDILAEGFATTARPDIEKLGGLAFGFSLNLKHEICSLMSTSIVAITGVRYKLFCYTTRQTLNDVLSKK